MRTISMGTALPSPLRRGAHSSKTLRVGLVQHQWDPDSAKLIGELSDGIDQAAAAGADIVCLPELTLSKYPGNEKAFGVPKNQAEDLLTGPTFRFVAEQAVRHGIVVHASLFEAPDATDQPEDPRGYNTAIMVGPDGRLIGRTRKLHIPITAGYYEDTYFRAGPSGEAYPVYAPESLHDVTFGLPTCWDEWFPELSRSYALAGADVLVYPTAIGSEPEFPGFDSQPIWQQVIVANGITSGMFMIVPNRHGNEGDITFYGSSFISDPYGRILVQAPRDESVVLVADIDISHRQDWLDLFPFFATRRPDSYDSLTQPILHQGHTINPMTEDVDA